MTRPATLGRSRGRRSGLACARLGLLTASLVLWFGPARANDEASCNLAVEMVGLESDEGRLALALFDRADAFDDDGKEYRGELVEIDGGRGEHTWTALPCGVYAVKVFHDENENGNLDTNFVGYPKESFGFSKDAMGQFGPPSFEDAKIELREKMVSIRIKMN